MAKNDLLTHLKHMIWLVEVELKEDGGHIVANAKAAVTAAEANSGGTRMPVDADEVLGKTLMQSKSGKSKAKTGSTSKDTGKQSPRSAANSVRRFLRSAMKECSGTEIQKLKAFERVLSPELMKIDQRIDELEPDTWGL
jgi:hypothetical protein